MNRFKIALVSILYYSFISMSMNVFLILSPLVGPVVWLYAWKRVVISL
jgi:hypothetical protein